MVPSVPRSVGGAITALLLGIVCAACGGKQSEAPPSSSPPPQPPQSPPTTGVTRVTGTERIAWDQEPMPGGAAAGLQFAAYVDITRGPLPDVRCAPRGDGILECTAQLPSMTPGIHLLRVASIGTQNGRLVESVKSEGIVVEKVTSGEGSTATSLVTEPTRDGFVESAAGAVPADAAEASVAVERDFVVERVAATSGSLADLAVSAGGDVFAAERAGRVLVLRRGSTTPLEGLDLTEVATSAGRGLFSIALHPDFETNGLIYMLYAAQTSTEPVYRIARGRAIAGRIGEMAVLLDAAPAASNGWGVLRFGPDRRLYVALGENQDRRTSAGAYDGKLIRLGDDGRLSSGDAAASPIVASIGGAPFGLLWTQNQARIILRQSRSGSDILYTGGTRDATVFNWRSQARPAGLAYVADSSSPGGHVYAGDLGGGVYRIPWPAPPSQRPLAGADVIARQYGAVRAVAAAPDGSVYFGTANIDMRPPDDPAASKDFIVRLRPRPRGPG